MFYLEGMLECEMSDLVGCEGVACGRCKGRNVIDQLLLHCSGGGWMKISYRNINTRPKEEDRTEQTYRETGLDSTVALNASFFYS